MVTKISGAAMVKSNKKNTAIREIRDRREKNNELIRRLIVNEGRFDLFATECCGYYLYGPHVAMIDHNRTFKENNMLLAFRGIGKTTIATVNDVTAEICLDPNIRILLTSSIDRNSKAFLKWVKYNLAQPRVTELFGKRYNSNKWSETEIEVVGKTSGSMEPTVRALGLGSSLASQHYDLIYADDLVTKDNSRTENNRTLIKNFFYDVLDPCPEPTYYRPGRYTGIRIRGTRYHPTDLYDHIMKNDKRFDNKILIIPSLNEQMKSNCPEKFSTEWLLEKKDNGGIHFYSQYQLDVSPMSGDVFDYDTFQYTNKIPDLKDLTVWMGVDLAIQKGDRNDKTAIVVVGMDESNNFYLLDYFAKRLDTTETTQKIKEFALAYNPIQVLIEANQYQLSKIQELKHRPDTSFINVIPFLSRVDKVTRAIQITDIFDTHRFWFNADRNTDEMADQLCMFPDGRFDDLVDALVLAVLAARGNTRVKKNDNFGLLGSTKGIRTSKRYKPTTSKTMRRRSGKDKEKK